MINFLLRRFVKNYDEINDPVVRSNYGLLGSYVGIVTNVFLSIFKMLVGLIFSSVSILADGFNNLSDAASSVVTLFGFYMSRKPADKDHPYGHARMEYLSGLIVSFIILLLGVQLIKSSVDKIIHPEALEFNVLMIVVLVVSILLKVWLCIFNRTLGNKINSTTMLATATDSLNDVIATSAVLLALLIGYFIHINLDGYMGVLVGLFVCWSGINLIKETINPLIGEAPSEEIITTIQDKLNTYKNISGYHDLIVHNYGPNKYFASVHAEVPLHADLLECHDVIDGIERDFNEELGIELVIHLDPIVTDDEQTVELKRIVEDIVKDLNSILTIHDFRLVPAPKHLNILFDISVPVDVRITDEQLVAEITLRLKKIDETYNPVITIDRSYITNSYSVIDK